MKVKNRRAFSPSSIFAQISPSETRLRRIVPDNASPRSVFILRMEELLDALGIPLDARSLPQETPRRERFSEGVTLTFYPDGSIIKENFK